MKVERKKDNGEEQTREIKEQKVAKINNKQKVQK